MRTGPCHFGSTQSLKTKQTNIKITSANLLLCFGDVMEVILRAGLLALLLFVAALLSGYGVQGGGGSDCDAMGQHSRSWCTLTLSQLLGGKCQHHIHARCCCQTKPSLGKAPLSLKKLMQHLWFSQSKAHSLKMLPSLLAG